MYEWKIPICIQHSESRSYIQWQISTINLHAIQYIYIYIYIYTSNYVIITSDIIDYCSQAYNILTEGLDQDQGRS